jgi:FtsH-binding integral membrane protein
MVSLGVLLVIIGVGSFVLPMIGVSIPALDPYQPWVGIIIAALGLITVLFGARRIRSSAVVDTSD